MTTKYSKYVCCTMDVTIATRFIAFIGIAISFLLMSVLFNDKMNSNDNYLISRKTALVLGLDWSHFHEDTNTHPDNDPEGKMIQIIMIFYSLAFLILNLVLFFGSIKMNWFCALPWLICELLGCISKFGALIYHLECEPSHLSRFFIVGSIIYICVIIWLWSVVFIALRRWKRTKTIDFIVEFGSIEDESPIKNHCTKFPSEC